MCICIAKIAIFLAVMLLHVDSAAALKCNGYDLKSLLAEHLRQWQCTLLGAWYVNVLGSVQCVVVYTG